MACTICTAHSEDSAELQNIVYAMVIQQINEFMMYYHLSRYLYFYSFCFVGDYNCFCFDVLFSE